MTAETAGDFQTIFSQTESQILNAKNTACSLPDLILEMCGGF